MTSAQQETIVAGGCEVAFDNVNGDSTRPMRQSTNRRKATLLDTGMAGGFGAIESRYELSLKVGADLVNKLTLGKLAQSSSHPAQVAVIKSSSSLPIHLKHMAELLAEVLAVQ